MLDDRAGQSRPCPSWCDGPEDHLDVHAGDDRDFHTGTVETLALSEIDGVRSASGEPLCVTVDQFVTVAKTHSPMVTLHLGDTGMCSGGDESLTSDEARRLASVLIRAAEIVDASSPPT